MTIKVSIHKSEPVSIVELEGILTIGEEITLFREVIYELKNKLFILNLTNLSYADSTGISALVSGLWENERKIELDILEHFFGIKSLKKGCMFKVLNLQGQVQQALEITKQLDLFENYENESEAIASFDLSA